MIITSQAKSYLQMKEYLGVPSQASLELQNEAG
jgi:hypothetical protein